MIMMGKSFRHKWVKGLLGVLSTLTELTISLAVAAMSCNVLLSLQFGMERKNLNLLQSNGSER